MNPYLSTTLKYNNHINCFLNVLLYLCKSNMRLSVQRSNCDKYLRYILACGVNARMVPSVLYKQPVPTNPMFWAGLKFTII